MQQDDYADLVAFEACVYDLLLFVCCAVCRIAIHAWQIAAWLQAKTTSGKSSLTWTAGQSMLHAIGNAFPQR